MGHLVNPYLTRLNKTVFPRSNWSVYTNNKSLAIFFFKDLNLITFFKWLQRLIIFKKLDITFEDVIIYRTNNGVFFNINYYNGRIEQFIFQIENEKKKLLIKNQQAFYNRIFILRLKFLFKFILQNLILSLFKYYILRYVKKILDLSNSNFIKLNLFYKTVKTVSANLIGLYVKSKIKQQLYANEIAPLIVKDLTKKIRLGLLTGFKLRFGGRFKKDMRATKLWYYNGPSPSGSFDKYIDFYKAEESTKMGRCGVKIWLYYSISSIKKKSLMFNNIRTNSLFENSFPFFISIKKIDKFFYKISLSYNLNILNNIYSFFYNTNHYKYIFFNKLFKLFIYLIKKIYIKYIRFFYNINNQWKWYLYLLTENFIYISNKSVDIYTKYNCRNILDTLSKIRLKGLKKYPKYSILILSCLKSRINNIKERNYFYE